MKYILLPIILFALSCGSQKNTTGNKTNKVVKENTKGAENELILVLKYPKKVEEAKQLIVNSGLTWKELIFDQEHTKIALIEVPSDKKAFWLERLKQTDEFKTVEVNKTTTLNTIKEEIETTFLAFRKTPCYGKCPVFDVRIDKNGKLFFNGIENVLVKGKKEIQLTEKEFSNLKKELSKTNFANYKDAYNNVRLMDAPSTYITYNQKEIQLRVWEAVPSELKNLYKYIDTFLATKKLYER